MTIDQMIAVLQAAKEGKTILDCDGRIADIQQRCAIQNLRVKPEPRELEAWFYHGVYNFSTLNLPECDRTRYINAGYISTKFREVIE